VLDPSSSSMGGQTGLMTPATTPTKRKRSSSGGDDEDEQHRATPSKRVRKPKREALEGVPFVEPGDVIISDARHVKFDDHLAMAATMDPFVSYHQQNFMPPEFFLPINGQIKNESRSSGCTSFVG